MSKKSQDTSPGEIIRCELGLSKSEWEIGIGYSKGALTDSRGIQVRMTHLPTGQTKAGYVPSKSKAAARRDAIQVVKEYIKQIEG